MWVPVFVAAASAAVLSAVATAAVRRYAIARSMFDRPNERSSHTVPTPRGGGLGIAFVVSAGVLACAGAGVLAPRLAAAFGGGGLVVAGVGWLDDRRGLGALPRAGAHAVAAVWTLLWLGGLPTLQVGGWTVPLGTAGLALGALFIVASINFYNFMDGIDGIAAGQAVVAGCGGAALCAMRGATGPAAVALLVAAASAGFLRWNWSPARIFMGDVGSGLLGFLFAALAVAGERVGGVPLVSWVLLLAPFFADAVLTLGRRVARGERWYTAHRRHAYQRAVQAGMSHARVSCITIALSAAHIPLAYMLAVSPESAPLLVAGSALLIGVPYVAIERVRPMY